MKPDTKEDFTQTFKVMLDDQQKQSTLMDLIEEEEIDAALQFIGFNKGKSERTKRNTP